MPLFIARCAILPLTTVCVLSACAPQNGPQVDKDPHAVQVMSAGQAQCLTTTASDNSTGAAATNAARMRAGLAPVRPNATLARAAAAHACDMAQRGRMTHTGKTTSGPAARVKALGFAPSVTAENIAAGPFNLPRVLSEWNTSSGHLANIMIPQVRDFGIGQAIGADGKTRFWAAIYAAPR